MVCIIEGRPLRKDRYQLTPFPELFVIASMNFNNDSKLFFERNYVDCLFYIRRILSKLLDFSESFISVFISNCNCK